MGGGYPGRRPGKGGPAPALSISSATGVTRLNAGQRPPATDHNNDEELTVDDGEWRTEPTLLRDVLPAVLADIERRCEAN